MSYLKTRLRNLATMQGGRVLFNLHTQRNMKDLTRIFGSIFLMVVSVTLNGYTLSVLWGWFMTPKFHLPELSISAAIGVVLIVRYVTYHSNDDDIKEIMNGQENLEDSLYQKIKQRSVFVLYKCLFTLLFGYIVHLFM